MKGHGETQEGYRLGPSSSVQHVVPCFCDMRQITGQVGSIAAMENDQRKVPPLHFQIL